VRVSIAGAECVDAAFDRKLRAEAGILRDLQKLGIPRRFKRVLRVSQREP